jgi:hypothetical protein
MRNIEADDDAGMFKNEVRCPTILYTIEFSRISTNISAELMFRRAKSTFPWKGHESLRCSQTYRQGRALLGPVAEVLLLCHCSAN